MAHRIIVHTSMIFSADFLLYNDHGREVLEVHGSDLPKHGKVDEVTFRALLKDIRAKEKARCRVKYAEKKAKVEKKFDPAHDGYKARGGAGTGFNDVYVTLRKVDRNDYPMTYSEWGYNYFPERF